MTTKKALANYCARHADQIEIKKKVVSAWDESTGGESASQEAAPGEIGLWPNESVTQGRRLVFAAFFCFPPASDLGKPFWETQKYRWETAENARKAQFV